MWYLRGIRWTSRRAVGGTRIPAATSPTPLSSPSNLPSRRRCLYSCRTWPTGPASVSRTITTSDRRSVRPRSRCSWWSCTAPPSNRSPSHRRVSRRTIQYILSVETNDRMNIRNKVPSSLYHPKLSKRENRVTSFWSIFQFGYSVQFFFGHYYLYQIFKSVSKMLRCSRRMSPSCQRYPRHTCTWCSRDDTWAFICKNIWMLINSARLFLT